MCSKNPFIIPNLSFCDLNDTIKPSVVANPIDNVYVLGLGTAFSIPSTSKFSSGLFTSYIGVPTLFVYWLFVLEKFLLVYFCLNNSTSALKITTSLDSIIYY